MVVINFQTPLPAGKVIKNSRLARINADHEETSFRETIPFDANFCR
jgi:hypothetical protein